MVGDLHFSMPWGFAKHRHTTCQEGPAGFDTNQKSNDLFLIVTSAQAYLVCGVRVAHCSHDSVVFD